VGYGPISLEPLVWHENPSAPGPPIYLSDRMSASDLIDYANELESLKSELISMNISSQNIEKTITAINGTLNDIKTIMERQK
ncbi:MAG: hypothetical protein ACPL7B_11420, partial [Candidatus Poribacteria bacterium]